MLDGVANAVTEEDGAADTTIKISWADWEALTKGALDAMTAFMQGKLKVEGDMSNAMQLQGVLAKLKSGRSLHRQRVTPNSGSAAALCRQCPPARRCVRPTHRFKVDGGARGGRRFREAWFPSHAF